MVRCASIDSLTSVLNRKRGLEDLYREIELAKINKEKEELLIATVASELPEELGEEYTNIFKNLGVKNVKILNIN
ncbi:hypothetical protein FCV28_18050, partial [Clostridium botulinum]|nr:hypothetical protein [Clostridium botulinum]